MQPDGHLGRWVVQVERALDQGVLSEPDPLCVDAGLALMMAPMGRPPQREQRQGWGLVSAEVAVPMGTDYICAVHVAVEDLKRGIVKGTNCTDFVPLN